MAEMGRKHPHYRVVVEVNDGTIRAIPLYQYLYDLGANHNQVMIARKEVYLTLEQEGWPKTFTTVATIKTSRRTRKTFVANLEIVDCKKEYR